MDLIFKLLNRQKMIIRKLVSWLNSSALIINPYVFKLKTFLCLETADSWGDFFSPYLLLSVLLCTLRQTLDTVVLCLYIFIISCHSLRSFYKRSKLILWHIFQKCKTVISSHWSARSVTCWLLCYNLFANAMSWLIEGILSSD